MKWIKISDRLPDEFEEVLWCNQEWVKAGAIVNKVIEIYNSDDCCQSDTYPINHFTHWVPLPLPVKETNEMD